MKITAITEKGEHLENEDRVIIGKSILTGGLLITQMDSGILAVADGVGGNRAGAVASDFLAKRLTELKDITIESLSNINRELIGRSSLDPALEGMATTLSGIMISPENIRLFHVGNTRVWFFRNEEYLKQITTDDTTVNYLMALGRLSPEDVDSYDRKSEITACFGAGNERMLNVKISHMDLMFPLVITSDGIHDYLSLDEMENILSDKTKSVYSRCTDVIIASENAGSMDDKSIIFIEG